MFTTTNSIWDKVLLAFYHLTTSKTIQIQMFISSHVKGECLTQFVSSLQYIIITSVWSQIHIISIPTIKSPQDHFLNFTFPCIPWTHFINHCYITYFYTMVLPFLSLSLIILIVAKLLETWRHSWNLRYYNIVNIISFTDFMKQAPWLPAHINIK